VRYAPAVSSGCARRAWERAESFVWQARAAAPRRSECCSIAARPRLMRLCRAGRPARRAQQRTDVWSGDRDAQRRGCYNNDENSPAHTRTRTRSAAAVRAAVRAAIGGRVQAASAHLVAGAAARLVCAGVPADRSRGRDISVWGTRRAKFTTTPAASLHILEGAGRPFSRHCRISGAAKCRDGARRRAEGEK